MRPAASGARKQAEGSTTRRPEPRAVFADGCYHGIMEKTASHKELTRRAFVAAAFGAAASAALGLSGCANGRPSATEASDSAQTSTETIKPTILSAVLNAEEATVLSSEGFFAVTPAMTMVKRHLFEGLYEIDPHTGKVSAALASGDPTVVNATTYEVELRADAAFSDGTPMCADHIADAYAEMISRSNVYATLLAPIATVTASNAHTVRITLTAEEGAFLTERLALIKPWITGPTAQGAIAGGYLGSGPWAWTAELPDGVCAAQIASAPTIASGDAATVSPSACAAMPSLPTAFFVPNPHHTEGGASAPAMSWSFCPDATERITTFTGGWALACADATADGTSILEDRKNAVEHVPGSLSPFLLFNCAKAPFDNVAVRQAMLYAIDYDRLISRCFDGHAAAATAPLPLTHPNYHRAATVYSHDVTRARHLLERAGITAEAPARSSLAVNAEWLRPIAELIAEELAEVAVNITVEMLDEAALAERSTLFDMALCADDPTLLGTDCDLFLTWRYGGNIAPESYAAWQSGEPFARMMENMRLARATTDRNQQQKLWNECFDIIAENVPLYPLCFCEIPTAWRSDALNGFSPLGTGCIDYLNVSLK